MFKNTVLRIAVLFITISGFSQKNKLDKVTEEELQMKVYEKDSAAPAVYLNKYRETYLDYESDDEGWIFINKITERIKILNKEGLEYATKRIRSFKRDKDREKVEDVSGVTYHLENGKIVEIPLEKDAIFESELSEFWDETAFTMPDARVGSIVEWSYETISPFYKIDDLILQEDIPVVDYYAKVRNPGMFVFRRVKKGFFDIVPEESIERRAMRIDRSVNVSSTNSVNITFQELIAEFSKKDIPALKDEPFLDNPRNYRMSIVYELISTEFNEGNKREYATTWEEVAKSIFKHPDFGSQLENTSFLKEVAASISKRTSTENEKIDAALRFMKSKMAWDGNYRTLVENDLRKAFKEGSGNSAEINLMLVALLRECGVDANPVLVSTKQHGIPVYPTREGFNYVVAGLRRNGETILLDATDKYAAPNILPVRVYNWSGRMINKQGVSQEIDLMETIAPSSNTFIKAELSTDGKLSGDFKQRLVSLEAFELRQDSRSVDEEKWKEMELKRYRLSNFDSYHLEGIDALEEPVVKSFTFLLDQAVDRIGDKMFLTPLSFLKLDENPFKSDSRQYPITFDYPFSKDVLVNIKLPEGYTVSSIPESVNLGLPDDSGTFFYSITENKGVLQVMMRFRLKKHIIPVGYYESLKEFFKLRVDKENEKVVLEKV